MVKLPTVLASSVIRSTHRGDSHGGIYKINLETSEINQLLDWNNPDINWEGRGGDRGIRGLAFFGNLLYAVAGNELFAFKLGDDGKLVKVASYTTPYMKLTHEAWRHRDKLYICSGGADCILIFDLVQKDWTYSWYHNKESHPETLWFNPKNMEEPYANPTEGFMHLDSVYANDDNMWYSGAYTDSLWVKDLRVNGVTGRIKLVYDDTHNARPWKGGYLYNLSRHSKTVWEKNGKIQDEWHTPHRPLEELTYTHLPRDHAVQGYTRGMVTYGEYVIVGTSPAAINVFKIGQFNPIKTVHLTNDIRNSICGMVLNEWE
jgi:hypothetical protein